MIFAGAFLLNPIGDWRVEWAGDIEGTLVHLDKPRRVWRLTGKREYGPGVIYYEGVWPD